MPSTSVSLPLVVTVLGVLALACAGPKKEEETDAPGIFEDQDQDDDGYVYAEDCDDADPAVHPGAQEVCDPVDADEDCDGKADSADDDTQGTITVHHDADGDGFGNAEAPFQVCEVLAGYVADATDCDDTRPDVHPGAIEVCDALDADEDCNAVADDDDPGVDLTTTFEAWEDTDGDGFGDRARSVDVCDLGPGQVDDATDCDPDDAANFPGADEWCDGADNDCDGAEDEADALDAPTWYGDTDRDGWGEDGEDRAACSAPSGYVATPGDCDDRDDAVHPDAVEVCNDTDDDCDGTVDPDTSADARTWYVDGDADGYGSATSTRTACDQPAGYVAVSTDCDDANAGVSPADPEVCDAANTDEDCDGAADDADSTASAGTMTRYYADADSDGYGSASVYRSACDVPSGYTTTATDCNDAAASVSPAGTEVCDAANTDEDCDGRADDNDTSVASAGKTTFYRDADWDGYGTTSATTSRCDAATGWASSTTDCDDAAGDVNPGETEVCDDADTDEDCDGLADDADSSVSASTRTTWSYDADGDGYGDDAVQATVCDPDPGYVVDGGDCDEADAGVHPDAPEVCGDAVDDDCDGSTTCEYGVSDAAVTAYGAQGLGYSLATAGDADGDGLDDFWAGSWEYATTSAWSGGIGLVTGAGGDTRVLPGDAHAWLQSSVGAKAGWDIASGDFDGDGVLDLAAGAPWWDWGDGAVLIATGPFSGTTELEDGWAIYEGNTASAGEAVAAGDTNGDGIDDLLASEPDASSSAGAAYLHTGLVGAHEYLPYGDAIFTGEAEVRALVNTGEAATLADLDGDGLDDVILGAPYRNAYGADSGAVYIFYAPHSGTTSAASADARISGTATYQYLGQMVESAGDVDGDGVEDLLVGRMFTASYLFTGARYGNSTTSTADASFGDTANPAPYVGALGGDLDGDGDAEVAVGGSYGGTEAVFVFSGGSALTGAADLADASVRLTAPGPSSYFGMRSIWLENFDGDAIPDLAVATTEYRSVAGNDGQVWVYAGADLGGAP